MSKIKCMICGKTLGLIDSRHLRKHNITLLEYRKKYPNEPTTRKNKLDEQLIDYKRIIEMKYIFYGRYKFINELEKIGTEATDLWYPHMSRDKEGKPDWLNERRIVNLLKRKTFNPKIKDYVPTEADILRGICKKIDAIATF